LAAAKSLAVPRPLAHQELSRTLPSEDAQQIARGQMLHSCNTASCIDATLFEKIGNLEVLPSGGHIVIPSSAGIACFAVQSGSVGALGD
jgi:hypothetical protein